MNRSANAFDIQRAVRGPWRRYIDRLSEHRPALHAYCRRLTGNVWDGEDLVQDALLRVFSLLGKADGRLENPKAYLIRTATNLWIDTVRRRAREQAAIALEHAEAASTRRADRPRLPNARRGRGAQRDSSDRSPGRSDRTGANLLLLSGDAGVRRRRARFQGLAEASSQPVSARLLSRSSGSDSVVAPAPLIPDGRKLVGTLLVYRPARCHVEYSSHAALQ